MKKTLLFSLLFLLIPGTAVLAADRIEDGKEITLTYKLLVNGEMLEEATAEKPFIYTQGRGEIVPGLEKGLKDLKAGSRKTIKVSPEEGYGVVRLEALQEVPKSQLPPDVPLETGTLIEARDPQGGGQLVKIVQVKDDSVVIDFNHPLAGKELEFQIEVLNIQ